MISIHIPDSVMSINSGAFTGCTSLSSIVLPKNIEIGANVFRNCATLHHLFRQSQYYNPRDLNIYNDFIKFLQNRYRTYPIHDICYHFDSQSVGIDHIRDKITSHISTMTDDASSFYNLITMDGLNMNPLHVLACNPSSTLENLGQVFQLLIPPYQKMILLKKMEVLQNDDDMYDPLQLYLKSRCMTYLPLIDALQVGMPWVLIKTWVLSQPELESDIVSKRITITTEKTTATISCSADANDQTKTSNGDLYPLMFAAKHSNCDLETVYNLALSSVEVLAMADQ